MPKIKKNKKPTKGENPTKDLTAKTAHKRIRSRVSRIDAAVDAASGRRKDGQSTDSSQ